MDQLPDKRTRSDEPIGSSSYIFALVDRRTQQYYIILYLGLVSGLAIAVRLLE